LLEALSSILSVIAISVSGLTAWATLFRRGQLQMTQPTVIFFGPDGARERDGEALPKVYLRTLLFSTGKRGRMIESMHLKVTRNESVQNFNIWVYGEEKLVRGSGLFVGEDGVSANHHFMTPKDGSRFEFVAGEYQIELFAKTLGFRSEKCIWSQKVEIDATNAKLLEAKSAGIYFDWGPDSKRYMAHVETKPLSPNPEELLRTFLPPLEKASG